MQAARPAAIVPSRKVLAARRPHGSMFAARMGGGDIMAAIHWLSGVSGDWSTGSNWSSGTVPGSGDDVTIAASGTYTVTISDNEAAHSLTLNDAGATVVIGAGNNNTFTVGSTLALTAGTLQLNQGSTIVGGTLSATGGSFLWNGGELSGVTYDGALNLTSGRAFL